MPDIETGIYRIVQEGLNNVVNHSQASEAQVTLKRTKNELLVTIEDNGKGMEAMAANNGHGHGLTGISERARMLGGTLAIDSSLGRGTTLSVRLGLSKKAK